MQYLQKLASLKQEYMEAFSLKMAQDSKKPRGRRLIMKRQVRWLLERANISQAGHGVALVKDALREINMEIETHSRNEKIDITENKRYYEIPEEAVKVLDIKVKII